MEHWDNFVPIIIWETPFHAKCQRQSYARSLNGSSEQNLENGFQFPEIKI